MDLQDVVATLKSPVLIELCDLFGDGVDDLDAVDDVTICRDVVFAASLQHSRADFTPRSAPELDRAASLVLRRLRSGWFTDTSVRSPQAHYSTTGAVGEAHVRDGDLASVMGEKPFGALWTSSYLPDGTSAWQWTEWAEFGHHRKVSSVEFDEAHVRVFSINVLADYAELIERYPRPLGDGRVQVRWTAVARDFDAVHLTVHGLVVTHHVGFTTRHGLAMMKGWDAECTAWLHDPRGSVRRAGDHD